MQVLGYHREAIFLPHYSIYATDLPNPIHDSTNIIYADDITQVVTNQGQSRKFLPKKIAREISNINS